MAMEVKFYGSNDYDTTKIDGMYDAPKEYIDAFNKWLDSNDVVISNANKVEFKMNDRNHFMVRTFGDSILYYSGVFVKEEVPDKFNIGDYVTNNDSDYYQIVNKDCNGVYTLTNLYEYSKYHNMSKAESELVNAAYKVVEEDDLPEVKFDVEVEYKLTGTHNTTVQARFWDEAVDKVNSYAFQDELREELYSYEFDDIELGDIEVVE